MYPELPGRVTSRTYRVGACARMILAAVILNLCNIAFSYNETKENTYIYIYMYIIAVNV